MFLMFLRTKLLKYSQNNYYYNFSEPTMKKKEFVLNKTKNSENFSNLLLGKRVKN